MAEQIKIMGGQGSHCVVSFTSDKFVSTAKYDKKTKAITCEVTSLDAPTPESIQKPKPITFALVIKGIAGLTSLFILFLVACRLLKIATATMHLPEIDPPDLTYEVLILMIVYCCYWLSRFRGWHGAEHMVFNAYSQRGSTDMEIIKTQSRTNARCGNQFIIPMIYWFCFFYCFLYWLFDFGTGLVTHLFFINISLIIAVASASRGEAVGGWTMIPMVTPLSLLFQRFISTSKPNAIQLETARTALIELIKRHEQP